MRKTVVLIVLFVVVVGGAALVVTNRPALVDARDETVRAWEPLGPPLTARYAQLDVLATQLVDVMATNGQETSEVDALSAATGRWAGAVDGGSAVSQAEAANDLEARAGRMRLLIAGSARLSQSTEIQEGFTAFANAAPPADEVAEYNDAVRRYQRTREEAFRRPVAQLFGFDPIPTLELTPAT